MAFNATETEELKQYILSQFSAISGEPGTTVTLTCDKDGLMWKDQLTGKEHKGCGETIASFEYKPYTDPVWDIAADLYVLHISNRHDLVVDLGPLT